MDSVKEIANRSSLLKRTNFSRNQLLMFALVFAAIGAYILFRTFAAAPLVASLEGENMILPSSTSTTAGTPVNIEAESMSHAPSDFVASDTTASGGKYLLFASNSTATSSLNLPTSSTSLSVKARGTACSNIYANMVVSVDSKQVISFNTNSSWQNATANINLSAGNHSLAIRFTNDAYKKGVCDRNLYVDLSSFNQQSTTTTSAIGAVETDATASNGKRLLIWSNGSATGQFNLPSQATSLTVSAEGSSCSGVGAHFIVYVDNSQLMSNYAASSSWQAFTSTTNLSSGVHTLKVTFDNDAYVAGSCDRNLYIDVTNFYGPVIVTPLPTVTLSASPSTITAGQNATLTWGSTNASSCVASGAWSGSEPTSGSFSTGALNQSSTYTLTCTGSGGTASSSTTVVVNSVSASPEFWSSTSFINNPVPTTATANSNSTTWINYLASTNTNLYVNWNQWTTPIYHADSSTPKSTFLIKNQNRHITFPYQSSFKQDNTADAGIAIIDDVTGCEYEFESFDPSTQTVNAEQTFQSIHTSSGLHANDSGVTGSDIAEIGGIITPKDISSGSINHALRLVTNFNAPQLVSPANRSDGTHSGGIPEGTLLQLDPNLDLTAYNLNPFQLMVAKALQKYGAYDADSSGTTFLVTAENTQDGSTYKYTPSNIPGSLIQHMRFLNPNIPTPSADSRTTAGCSQPF